MSSPALSSPILLCLLCDIYAHRTCAFDPTQRRRNIGRMTSAMPSSSSTSEVAVRDLTFVLDDAGTTSSSSSSSSSYCQVNVAEIRGAIGISCGGEGRGGGGGSTLMHVDAPLWPSSSEKGPDSHAETV